MLVTIAEINQRLRFARKRLDQLLSLNGGDLLGAKDDERLQLFQEFFFHLIGSAENVAGYVNYSRNLNIPIEQISIKRVVAKINESSNPLKNELCSLYADTRKQNLPDDPYSDEGYNYRAWNYRNQVTHRHKNPLLFKLNVSSGERQACLILDPRKPEPDYSYKPVQDDLSQIFDLFKKKCARVVECVSQ